MPAKHRKLHEEEMENSTFINNVKASINAKRISSDLKKDVLDNRQCFDDSISKKKSSRSSSSSYSSKSSSQLERSQLSKSLKVPSEVEVNANAKSSEDASDTSGLTIRSTQLLIKKSSRLKRDHRKELNLIDAVSDENKLLKTKLKKLECKVNMNCTIAQEKGDLLEIERSVNDKLQARINNERKERLNMSSCHVLKATKKMRKNT